MKRILTIAIPTYNRSRDLARLLGVLYREAGPLEEEVSVLVSDNASSDDTADVIADAAAGWSALVTRRNATNVGADRNFCLMLDQIETRYFWVIGDDDIPKIGALASIVDLLRLEEPALLYMQSDWRDVVDPNTAAPDELRYRVLDRRSFGRAVHIWTTFISGMVIDRLRLAGHDPRRYVDTNLVQLGWVLPVLATCNRFVIVEDACVVATQDNSGGYGVLTVFGVNFPRIARELLASCPALAEQMIDIAIKRYLPSLIWSTRRKAGITFSNETPWLKISKALGRNIRFWLILLPLGVAPLPVARLLYEAWQIGDRLRVKVRKVFRADSRIEGLKSIGRSAGTIP